MHTRPSIGPRLELVGRASHGLRGRCFQAPYDSGDPGERGGRGQGLAVEEELEAPGTRLERDVGRLDCRVCRRPEKGHGVAAPVSDAEQQTGQRLVFDIAFEVEDCDATVTDRLEDTIDYGAVCEAVALIATERSYRTLERLCTTVADMLEERFSAANVVVRATKPEPPIPLPVEEVSVEVER